MYKRTKQHAHSISHALNGIFWVFKTQPNFQFHIVVAAIVLLFALFLSISTIELVMLIMVIFLVIICEMINTVIEVMIDMGSTEWKVQSKIAKDISAGMVLCSAIASLCVGIIVFVPYLVKYI
ncbi:MAG: diacylglycerol kinase family protein [bacterium]|nr:diacylglycerol kinase family protein [bacterium]